MRDKIIKATKDFAEKYYGGEKEYSEKAKELARLSDQVGGCRNSKVRELVSLITGIDLPPGESSEGVTFGKYVAIVPLACRNSHNYKIGKPCVSRGGPNGLIRMDGTKGNTMDSSAKSLRPATVEEIDEWMEAITTPRSLKEIFV